MVLKYHLSPSAIDEDFVIYIYEAANTTPGAHVDTLVVPKGPGPGHPNPETITFNGLDKVVHVVKMYSAISLALLHDYNAEPKEDTVEVFAPIQFKIGDGGPDTPAANQPTAVTPGLIGLTTLDFWIFRNGYGVLFPGIHYDFNPADGTWNLLQPGDVFSGDPAEEFTIIRQPSVITTVVNDSVVGKWFGGFVDVAANTIYDASHLRKLVRFSGSPEYEFTFDPPIGYGYAFQHFGNDGTATIKFTNKPLRWINGTDKAELEIKSGREALFTFDGAKWNVVYLVDSNFAEDPGITPGTVLGIGNFAIGDVPGGDPAWAITHNLDIDGDYKVFLSIDSKTGAQYVKNNKIGMTWWHHNTDKPNKFNVSLQEISPEVQDCDLTWMIVKA